MGRSFQLLGLLSAVWDKLGVVLLVVSQPGGRREVASENAKEKAFAARLMILCTTKRDRPGRAVRNVCVCVISFIFKRIETRTILPKLLIFISSTTFLLN